MEKIGENLDFVENSNFTRESTEAAVRGFSVINSQENTRGRVEVNSKVTERNSAIFCNETLPQVVSCETVVLQKRSGRLEALRQRKNIFKIT